jgi:hypothetical protein
LIYTASNNKAFQAALTSRNIMKVKNFVKQILKDKALNLVIILQIKKLNRVAVKVLANTII